MFSASILGLRRRCPLRAAYWPETGRRPDCHGLFSQRCQPCRETWLQDGVGRAVLSIWRRGENSSSGGRRVSDIAEMLREVADRWGHPLALSCDRWREQELREKLENAGFPIARLEVRGMGYRDGSEDVRAFRSACMGGLVSPVVSLLLTSAMSEARITYDVAGNGKLAKSAEGGRRSRAKDDAAAASILAVSCGVRLWRDEKPRKAGVYMGMV